MHSSQPAAKIEDATEQARREAVEREVLAMLQEITDFMQLMIDRQEILGAWLEGKMDTRSARRAWENSSRAGEECEEQKPSHAINSLFGEDRTKSAVLGGM